MTTDDTRPAPHYWYSAETDRERAIDVLEHIRAYGAADSAMQRRSEKTMRMNENDISALRYLLRASERGMTVGPRELADYLGIQSSSITVLLDRLEKAGHIRREPSPFDRRALIIVPTVPTDELHKAILGDVREELVEVASKLTPEDADTVVEFMDRLRDAVDRIDNAAADHEQRKARSSE
ncbi:MarR family winged helix-turn-helix transcriptional regulator [Leifsonia sp. TF02-11]|uniref:MarR family winged helix-turn-helix transcriptional regulator n=1 Tax=Leifsonia sp. TF02-11 TaxID=2815212 RepID=UPI001AA0C80B|nr:MarR family transcriptional regulator [Leifsonia sp. TF02-11]MBN9630117.1 MarR family transcriptional regulator [Actinomycetota bacterium]MBO1739461.1 MarR family transcriptional regulator [Leifsonia sp. TF02-11]